MKITRKRNLLNGAGIFAGSLTVAAVAVYFYSPVIGSHADTTTIGAEVNAMIALTTPENLRLEVTPSAAGATASDSITATVNTNSTYGYELYFSATDTDTSMTSETSSSTITSDFTTTSLANIPVNSWGYSLDDTDYSPIPTSENSTRIKSVEHLPTGNELATSIYFGTKVSTSLASGFYSDNVLFSAVAIAPPPPPTMQGFDDLTMLPNVGDSIQLQDTRDGKTYTVARLADGQVWMTENLRITNKTITSEDSNIPSGETFTIPASDISAFTESYDTSAAYLDSTYGGYYNFYTATAGWGTYSESENEEQSPQDICPKGWRLPKRDGSINIYEYYNLRDLYESDELLAGGIVNITMGGEINSGVIELQGDAGTYWYNTVMNSESVDVITFDSTGYAEPWGHYKYNGASIRCIAKKPTMQTFNAATMLPNTGDSMEIEDERDGNVYTVKRLADGNVWMTENLKIAGKTITSEDSDVVSNFTIPASSLDSGFSNADSNAVYVKDPYGGHYTFYTATAGTGGTSLTSGNAPSSICPKGWGLPTGGIDEGEIQTLASHYSSSDLIQGDPAFTLGGYAYNTYMASEGTMGLYWSSSVYNADYARSYSASNGTPTTNRKFYGYSVRCLAR